MLPAYFLCVARPPLLASSDNSSKFHAQQYKIDMSCLMHASHFPNLLQPSVHQQPTMPSVTKTLLENDLCENEIDTCSLLQYTRKWASRTQKMCKQEAFKGFCASIGMNEITDLETNRNAVY